MKKFLVLLLGVLLLVPSLAACSPELTDKGATIPVYLSGQVTTVDPMYLFYNDNNAKVASLLYQCMTTVNEDGEVELAAAKKYTIIEDPANNTYGMEFVLNETAWNDGRAVSSDDFAFAWRRVLDPAYSNEAACLLFDIKNAKAYNNNTLDGSKYEVGIIADDDKLTVYFEGPIDYDQFLRNLSALSLAPLREDMVSTEPEIWGSIPSLICANGPFYVKKFEYGKIMVLERNAYYYRDTEKDEYYDIVTPYQLIIDLTKDGTAQLADYKAGNIYYMGELQYVDLAAEVGNLIKNDMMTVHTYYLNTTKAPFNDPNVRKALSLALDRAAIEQTVPLTKAATGFITNGVVDTTAGTSFREQGGTLLSHNMAEAKQLIAAATITDTSFTITYAAADETALAIANYAKQQWTELGFKVTVKAEKAKHYDQNKNEYERTEDDYRDTLLDTDRDFDVIALDYQMPTTDAFAALAPFAPTFSGGAIALEDGVRATASHITGYRSVVYEALIATASDTRNPEKRAGILHDAEELLLNDMPIIPVVTMQNGYMVSDDLDGIYVDFRGFVMFDKTELKTYEPPEVEETEGA